MIFDNKSPIVVRRRKGTIDDPFIEIEEFLTVSLDGKVTLTEIPERYSRVLVQDNEINLSEIENEILTETNYLVDYTNKLVTFHKSQVGKQFKFIYKGTGLEYVPTSMIYTKLEDGEVVETLGDIIENSQTTLDKINQGLTDIDSIKTDAIEKANYAKTQGDYAKTQGEFANEKGLLADEKATLAQTATTNANLAIDKVNNTIDTANKVVTNANDTIGKMETLLSSSVFLGDYNDSTSYVPNNLVRYNNAIYRCLINSNNINPDNTTHWVKYLSIKEIIDLANQKIDELKDNNTQANSLINNLSNTIQNAETKISETETARQNAISSSTTANNAANLATEKATLADTATTNINKKITELDDKLITVDSKIKDVEAATNDANKATLNVTTSIANFEHLDEYSSDKSYKAKNIVSYNGSSYMCVLDCINIPPTNATNWKLLSSKGDQGEIGNDGKDGISFIYRGNFVNNTEYHVNDVVTHDGSSYIAIKDNTNVLPTDEVYWNLMVSKGQDGLGSVISVNGKTGEVVLNAQDVGALPSGTVIPTKTSDLTNDSSFETTTGSQEKVDAHANNKEIHITKEERIAWNNKVNKSYVDAELAKKINNSEKGVPNGIALLNKDGKVVDSKGNEIEGKVTSVNGQVGDVVIETNMTKLAKYHYLLTATTDNQTDFTIPLETFDIKTDYLLVIQNSNFLDNDSYTISGQSLTLKNGVVSGTELYISIIKNILTDNGAIISGALIEDGTIDLTKLRETVVKTTDLNSYVNVNKIGVPNGVASLNANGKVPSTQLDVDLSDLATKEAVKTAYDRAEQAFQSASNGKKAIATAITGKGVATSATDTFETMATNISSIKSGYGVGDIIPSSKISVYLGEAWKFTGHTNSVNDVAVDNEGNIYSASTDKTVRKINSSGGEAWKFTGHTGAIYGVAVDSNGNIYSGSGDNTVRKIDSSGVEIWKFTGHTDWVRNVAVDSNGNVYSVSDDNTVRKISSNGEEVWKFRRKNADYGGMYPYRSLAVDNNGNVYIADDDVTKIDSNGRKVWMTNMDDGFFSLAVDNNENIYVGSDAVIKIDSNGRKVWKFTGHDGGVVCSVAVDNFGNVYAGTEVGELIKINSNGTGIWRFTGHDGYDVYSVAVDSNGNIYSASMDKAVRKIIEAYKIIA